MSQTRYTLGIESHPFLCGSSSFAPPLLRASFFGVKHFRTSSGKKVQSSSDRIQSSTSLVFQVVRFISLFIKLLFLGEPARHGGGLGSKRGSSPRNPSEKRRGCRRPRLQMKTLTPRDLVWNFCPIFSTNLENRKICQHNDHLVHDISMIRSFKCNLCTLVQGVWSVAIFSRHTLRGWLRTPTDSQGA